MVFQLNPLVAIEHGIGGAGLETTELRNADIRILIPDRYIDLNEIITQTNECEGFMLRM
jgi:hypothetical protein